MASPGKVDHIVGVVLMGFLNLIKNIFFPKPKRRDNFAQDVLVDYTVEAKSFSTNEKYIIHVGEITCTCPDFAKRRHLFTRDDPRRLCKHLIKTLLKTGEIPESFNKYIEKFQGLEDSKRGFPLDKYSTLVSIRGQSIEIWLPDNEMCDHPPGPWCDIYIRNERYSYNHNEGRWSRENKPAYSDEIIKYIHEELGLPIPAEVEEGSIKTIEKKGSRLQGRVGDVIIFASIETRASWQIYGIHGKHGGTINVKTGENKIHPSYRHMEKAITKWITDEYLAMRQEKKKPIKK